MTIEDVPDVSAEKIRELLSELATLSKLQTDALEDLAYLGMSAHRREEYDKRRLRIGELCEIITQYRPPKS